MRARFPLCLCFLLIVSLIWPAVAVQAQTGGDSQPDDLPSRIGDRSPEHLGARLLSSQPVPGMWGGLPQGPTSRLPITIQAAPVTATSLASGSGHTCALASYGGVKCWGDNYLGQLGDGTTVDRATPVSVVGLQSGVVSIAASHKHTCALMENGTVRCWGYNRHGEQGDGTQIDHPYPVEVPGLNGVVAIAVGGFHTCVLIYTGGVKCWGANWHGQVGDGTIRERLSPVDVDGLDQGIIAIAAGKYHTCAIKAAAGVKCWGYNASGQIGNGDTIDAWIPRKVVGDMSNAVALGLGELHSCALTREGRVKCWGGNSEGQLGDGTTNRRIVPGFVVGLDSGVVALTGGAFHNCVRMEWGSARCWGSNWAGQLGDGTNTLHMTPTDPIGMGAGVTALEAGESHTCAVVDAGQVQCWGSNAFGQLGIGSTALRLTPVESKGLQGEPDTLGGGALHTCALSSSGGLRCWGNNKYGQLGDGTIKDSLTPVDVAYLSSGVVFLAVGGFHTCAVTHQGGAWCWGDNSRGQLGDGTTEKRLTPTSVTGLSSGVAALAAGYEHTCALTTAGGVKCWGNNQRGRLGNGTNTPSLTPVDVVGLTGGVVTLAAGESHTCALTVNNRVKCWGNNFDGQLGDGTNVDRWTPETVKGLPGEIVTITAGAFHTCAHNNAGEAYCWGGNFSGQIGDGTLQGRLAPARVAGLGSAVNEISAGGFHTCARLATGEIRCWGDNWMGQIGDGTTIPRLVPVTVSGLSSDSTGLGSGAYHTCSLRDGGAPQCWGGNANGQISDGSLPWAVTAVKVVGLTPAKLLINHSTGKPGSTFTLTGQYFPPDSAVILTANGYTVVSAVPVDSQGSFEILLTTIQANEGFYTLSSSAILKATTALRLDMGAPLRERDGSGIPIDLPPGIAYANGIFFPLLSFR